VKCAFTLIEISKNYARKQNEMFFPEHATVVAVGVIVM